MKFLNQSALKDFRKLEIEDQPDGTRGFHFHYLAKIESVLFKIVLISNKSAFFAILAGFGLKKVEKGLTEVQVKQSADAR